MSTKEKNSVYLTITGSYNIKRCRPSFHNSVYRDPTVPTKMKHSTTVARKTEQNQNQDVRLSASAG